MAPNVVIKMTSRAASEITGKSWACSGLQQQQKISKLRTTGYSWRECTGDRQIRERLHGTAIL